MSWLVGANTVIMAHSARRTHYILLFSRTLRINDMNQQIVILQTKGWLATKLELCTMYVLVPDSNQDYDLTPTKESTTSICIEVYVI